MFKPVIANSFKRGVNAENIAGGRRLLYSLDTWTTLKAKAFTHARIPVDMVGLDEATLVKLDTTLTTITGLGFVASLCPFGVGTDLALLQTTLTTLVTRYHTQYTPGQLAFELRNEPSMFTADQWNLAVKTLTAAIWSIAPQHVIVIPPVGHSLLAQLPNLTLVKGPVVYTVHFYEPPALTQQGQGNGAVIDPTYVFPAPEGTLGSTGLYTLSKLALRIKTGSDWAKLHDVPLMFGEFGCTSDAPAAARLAWAGAVRHNIEGHSTYLVGWSWWGVNGRKFGLRPLEGAWDQPLLDVLTK